MTTHINNDDLLQLIASQDLIANAGQFKVVTFAGAISADNTKAAGILWAPNVQSMGISVVYEGVIKAYVGAAVGTVGYGLKCTTSGYLIAASSGDTTVGRMLDATAASGDIARVFVDFQSLGYWTSA